MSGPSTTVHHEPGNTRVAAQLDNVSQAIRELNEDIGELEDLIGCVLRPMADPCNKPAEIHHSNSSSNNSPPYSPLAARINEACADITKATVHIRSIRSRVDL